MTKRHFSSLCVDAGLPLSGPGAAAASAVLRGLQMQISSAGLSVGGYRIRLCRIFDDSAGVVTDARRAAENPQTIAYVGELSGSQASVADAVLSQAGVALVSPSGPAPVNAPASATGASVAGAPTPAPPKRTTLYLLPAAKTQADALADLRAAHSCGRRRGGRPACTVLSMAAAPLCTGIGRAPISAPPRFCAVAGSALSDSESPALAYGDSAGELLISSLKRIAAGHKDVGDRATVLHELSHANLRTSPIGPIRFDSEGGIAADDFTAYTVKRNGGLVLPRTFRTH